MEILFGTEALEPRAYLVNACEHLERLGHEVHVFADKQYSAPAELRVVTAERGLPLAPDVIYAQDAYAALLLADLYPLTPQVFAAHGDGEDSWLPPQLAGVVARVVVFDDRTAERVRASALPQDLVRLSRPVDTDRFKSSGSPPERPRRAVLDANGLSDYRRGVAERATADAGIELGHPPDMVIGTGLRVLEGMASGLAAYVYGDDGGDGWVTPERYEVLEADGFAGRAGPPATNFEQLRRDLDRYEPAMGPANRELALAHSARTHAGELVRLFEELSPRRDPVSAPLRELARLVRVDAATARRADAAAADAGVARELARRLEQSLSEARERIEELDERAARLEQALAEAIQQTQQQQAPPPRGVRGLLGREGKVPSTEG